MPIFEIDEDTPPEAQAMAKGVLQFANQIGDTLVRLHRQSREMLFYRADWTVEDLQSTVDAMGANAIPLFEKSAALAAFLHEHYPGALDAAELASPIPYTVDQSGDAPRIVFDPEAEYPGPEASQD